MCCVLLLQLAYRRKAKELHPDLNKAEGAHTAFIHVTEVLLLRSVIQSCLCPFYGRGRPTMHLAADCQPVGALRMCATDRHVSVGPWLHRQLLTGTGAWDWVFLCFAALSSEHWSPCRRHRRLENTDVIAPHSSLHACLPT